MQYNTLCRGITDFVKVKELYTLIGLAETTLALNCRALYAKGSVVPGALLKYWPPEVPLKYAKEAQKLRIEFRTSVGLAVKYGSYHNRR